MANVQELLLAAQANRSPLQALLEGGVSGFGEGLSQGPERMKTMMDIEDRRVDRQRALDEDKRLRAQIAGAQESKTTAAFSAVGGQKTPAHPGMRLSRAITKDPKTGLMREDIKVLEPRSMQAKEYIDEKGRARIGAWDPEMGKLIKSTDDEMASGRDRGTVVSDLRKEFIGLPEVKDFVVVDTAVRRMDALMRSATSGDQKSRLGIDQALISIYNKITDPSSVVRESEYARTPEGMALISRMTGRLEQLQTGGAGLTDEERTALVHDAKTLANATGSVFNERRGLYERQAHLQQADPEGVIGTIPAFKTYDLGPKKKAPATAASWTTADEARLKELEAKLAKRGGG